MNDAGATSDSLVDALLERGRASLDEVATTTRLALAEARLALSSVGLLLLIALLLAATLLVVWLLLMAMLGLGLLAAGMATGWMLLVLLCLHLLLGAALGWAGWQLSKHLTFRHTREAIAYQRAVPDDPV